jgi:hypothetical protein
MLDMLSFLPKLVRLKSFKSFSDIVGRSIHFLIKVTSSDQIRDQSQSHLIFSKAEKELTSITDILIQVASSPDLDEQIRSSLIKAALSVSIIVEAEARDSIVTVSSFTESAISLALKWCSTSTDQNTIVDLIEDIIGVRQKALERLKTNWDALERQRQRWDGVKIKCEDVLKSLSFVEGALSKSKSAKLLEILRGGRLTEEELESIQQATSYRFTDRGYNGSSRWNQCPNGHPYLIGDCGAAMQESQCPECGARIGGGSHQLRPDNSALDISSFNQG